MTEHVHYEPNHPRAFGLAYLSLSFSILLASLLVRGQRDRAEKQASLALIGATWAFLALRAETCFPPHLERRGCCFRDFSRRVRNDERDPHPPHRPAPP